MARCCIPSSLACFTSFLMRLNPSSSEYSVWTCKCAKSAPIKRPSISQSIDNLRVKNSRSCCQGGYRKIAPCRGNILHIVSIFQHMVPGSQPPCYLFFPFLCGHNESSPMQWHYRSDVDSYSSPRWGLSVNRDGTIG